MQSIGRFMEHQLDGIPNSIGIGEKTKGPLGPLDFF